MIFTLLQCFLTCFLLWIFFQNCLYQIYLFFHTELIENLVLEFFFFKTPLIATMFPHMIFFVMIFLKIIFIDFIIFNIELVENYNFIFTHETL